MRARTAAVLASGLLAAALLTTAPARSQTIAPAAVTWPSLRLVDGGTLDAGRLNASPVIVVFWATWCGFCERHNARVERLHRTLQGGAPLVVGVSIDGDAAGVGRLARERGWTFPVAVDTGSIRRQFTPRRLVPMTCIVGTGGQVRQCIPGEMSDDDVMALGKAARS
jgi:thiol-disulfide isomerase/thioredoxin